MFRSIRWTLQIWHAGLLATVLAGFAAASYFGMSRMRFEEIDSGLNKSVQVVQAALHVPPPQGPPGSPPPPRAEFRGAGPDGDSPGDFGPRPPPPARGGRPGPGNFERPPQLIEISPTLVQRFSQFSPPDAYYVVWNRDGLIVHSLGAAADVPRPALATNPAGPELPQLPQIRQRGDLREAYIGGPAGTSVLVGRSIQSEQVQLQHFAWLLAGTGSAVLMVGLAGGWLLSYRVVRPINQIAAAARDISATNLARRIDTTQTHGELGALAAVLNEMFQRLDTAFQQQVRFTADASHELRTPLAVIHTQAQLALARTRSADDYREILRACLRSTDRMNELVDSLLLLARADAGGLALNRGPMDLRDVAEDCVELLRPLAARKSLTLTTDFHPAEISADAARIAQVVTNLLTNAIRYSRKNGTIHVASRIESGRVTLTVADQGVGIPAENQPFLFERFFRGEGARNREDGGSGLGLAICKSIVEAHGGSIACISEPGKGTTFTVRLPVDQSQRPPAAT
jgi:heavy metal sensor kinase